MKAYQRVVREQRAATEGGLTLFGKYWDGLDLRLDNADIRPITRATAERVVLDHEWLGTMPAISTHHFGIYFSGVIGGALVFGPEYSENLGWWDRYGFTGRMILLSRGACMHWTPPNTASYFISRAISLLPPKFEVVTATVDELAGEVGTIYQSLNWHFVGKMRESNPIATVRHRDDGYGVVTGGRMYGSRSMRAKMGGTLAWEEIVKRYPDARKVFQANKSRYFYFRSKRNRRKDLESITDMVKPYPKRHEDGPVDGGRARDC